MFFSRKCWLGKRACMSYYNLSTNPTTHAIVNGWIWATCQKVGSCTSCHACCGSFAVVPNAEWIIVYLINQRFLNHITHGYQGNGANITKKRSKRLTVVNMSQCEFILITHVSRYCCVLVPSAECSKMCVVLVCLCLSQQKMGWKFINYAYHGDCA